MLFEHDRRVRNKPIPQDIEASLRLAFFSDQRSQEQLARAREFLVTLHSQRLWLACDCVAGAGDTWPMIGPRDGRGGMHPFRFGHISHLDTCPFAADIRRPESNLDGDEDFDNGGPLEGAWDLHQLFPQGQSTEARRAQLSRLLRSAVSLLGIDRLHISSFERLARGGQMRLLETPFARLKHLGDQDMGDGQRFRDVGLTFLPALPRLLQALGRRKPEEAGVAGLFLGIVEEALGPDPSGYPGYLSAKDQKGVRRAFPVQGQVFHPQGEDGRRGPFWTVALLGRDGSGRAYLGDTLVLHALDRRTLLPTPTAEHRGLARVLLEQMDFWRSWKRLELEVELGAPLFPSPYPREPAFELVLPGGQTVGVDLPAQDAAAVDAGEVLRVSVSADALAATRKRLTGAISHAHRLSTQVS